MFLAVWILYAADRLLDAARAPACDLEARHRFHQHHRRAFCIGIAIAAMALAALLPSLYPDAIRLYLIEGALLFAWFVILHATGSAHRLPKEIAVGLFFSAAVFIPTIGREPGLRAEFLPAAILFGALCSMNCLFIYAWEHDALRDSTAHASTRLALAHLPALAVTAAIAGAALTLLAPSAAKPIAAACGLSALFLLALHRNRRRLSRIDLRAAADLALLSPVLLLPFLR
jgi:hypothetical protein